MILFDMVFTTVNNHSGFTRVLRCLGVNVSGLQGMKYSNNLQKQLVSVFCA